MIDFYMTIAEDCAQMSRATRLQVGSVVVKNDNILSFSWNGMPSGWDNTCENYYTMINDSGKRVIESQTKPEVLHAEMNALMKLTQSTESAKDATLFVTHAPCIECAKGIYQAGIKEVYYKNVYRSKDGLKFLEYSGIKPTCIGNNR